MIVVADTSPLNYLVLLGNIEILAKIYGEVVVPQTVLDELQDNDAPAEVRAWFQLARRGCRSLRSPLGETPSWID
jgi:predicted nucleic acid-binding protein